MTFFHAAGVVARDEQVFFDGRVAFHGALGFAAEHAQDAVRVTHRRHFGVGHHQCFVGKVHSHHGAHFDTGGGVAHDVVELHVFEFVQYTFHTVLLECVFVTCL